MTQVSNVLKDNYNMMLLHDYLKEEIKEAGFSNAEISKTPTGTKITLFVTRPGIVIGRKGTNIKLLTDKLESDFGLKNPQIAVEEVANPDLSPSVMCNRMAVHLERGIAFRRATMWTIQQIMDSNAMGVQITISGKLRGDRSAFEKHTAGILPRSGHHAKIIVSEDIAHVKTAMGLIGIRIRIAIKEKFSPEFKLNKDDKTESEDLSSKKKINAEQEQKTSSESEQEQKASSESEQEQKASSESEQEQKASSESEQIKLDEAKIKMIDSKEEEEENLK
jgi:small subunit ribosomal protein S3